MGDTTWERVTAAELRRGDVFAVARDVQRAMVVVEVQTIGEASRYLAVRSAAGSSASMDRIRPRHGTRFWRVV